MANQIVPFNDDMNQLPAHLREQFGDMANSELAGGISAGYPVLSFKGKTWSLREGGTSTVIMRDDDEPASAIEVVLVKANSNLSKVYYESGYVEGSDAKPTCYSNDGHAPEADAAVPQCTTCGACPRNAWGSRITEGGKKGKSCSDSRRIAVVPSGELGRAMLLRIPAATLKDLAAYSDMLTRRNAPYQAVVTKIGFEHSVAHPQLTFKAVRWLDADEAKKITELLNSDVIGQITGSTPRVSAPAIAAPTPTQRAAPVAQAAPVAPKKAAPEAVSSFGKPKAAPAEAVATPVSTKAASKPKTGGFTSPAPEPKAEPEPSRAASRIAAANSELDAALAELDDQ